jgi:YD repeat-containing protein
MASRLLLTAYSDGLNDTFAYDDDGRQILAVSARYGTSVEKTYLANGLLASEMTAWNGVSKTVGYVYDAANRQTGVVYPDGRLVSRTYNRRDQLSNVTFDNTSVATYRVYMENCLTKVVLQSEDEPTRTGFALGSPAFVERARKAARAKTGREVVETHVLHRRIAWDELVRYVEAATGERFAESMCRRGSVGRPLLLWAARRSAVPIQGIF